MVTLDLSLIPMTTLRSPNGSSELSRLIAAAIINQKFRELLLKDPLLAMEAGFNGEAFHLDPDYLELVLSIRAQSLSDFASQLAERHPSKKGGQRDLCPPGKATDMGN